MCLRTGTMDFFVTARSGALRFISCDVKTTISSNTLPPSPEGRGTREELLNGGVSKAEQSALSFGEVSLSPPVTHSCQFKSLKGRGGGAKPNGTLPHNQRRG